MYVQSHGGDHNTEYLQTCAGGRMLFRDATGSSENWCVYTKVSKRGRRGGVRLLEGGLVLNMADRMWPETRGFCGGYIDIIRWQPTCLASMSMWCYKLTLLSL